MTGDTARATRRGLVAIGYQGFGNLGDEAILTGIEAALANSDLSVDFVVCGPMPVRVVAFPEAARIQSPRLLPTPTAIRAISRAEGLALAGGGLIHDHWPTVIPRYLAWILLARLLGRPVVWIGVGVGPIRRRTQRMLATLARRMTTLALVRDASSAALLGGEGERVRIIPDPALFNDPPRSSRPADADRLGIIVRGPVPGAGVRAARLAAVLVDVARAASAGGWRPTYMTMAGDADADFVRRLVRASAAESVATDIVALGPTPEGAIATLAGCRGVVTVRLHGLLLAVVAGVPAVAVAYDAKVSAVAAELGVGDLVLDPSELTADRIMARLEVALEPVRRQRLAAELERVRSRMGEVATAVDEAVRGR